MRFVSGENMLSAGGILFYRKTKTDIQVLLGSSKVDEWTFLGGKREEYDDSIADTAIREFYEETSGIFEDMIHDVNLLGILHHSPYINFSRAKYRLYIVSIDDEYLYSYMKGLELRFIEANTQELPRCMKEMCSIAWLSHKVLFNPDCTSSFIRNCVARNPYFIQFFYNMYMNNLSDNEESIEESKND